jgi:hypothetical protein
MIFCVLMAGICTADDCGCGGFDTSPPGYGWESPGFSGLDTHDSSNGGSTSGSAGSEPSDSGSSPSAGNSISDTGSSGGSSTGDSGGAGGSESSFDSALQYAIKGATYYKNGDMNQSLEMLNKSLSLDPYSVRAWMTKGDVLSAMGRYVEAAAAYSKVLQLDPSDGAAAAKRGDAFLDAGKYQEAVASYDRAIAMDPGISGLQTNRSRAKELASGVIQANLSVAEKNGTVQMNSGGDLTPGISPGSPPDPTQVPVSPLPGTTKAPFSILPLLLAIMITTVLSIFLQRHS